MNFRTQIPHQKAHHQITYDAQISLFGSCFTNNIGSKLNYFKFKNTINPFGIIFHPKAIEKLIIHSINQKVYTDNDLFFHNERWHCFDVHSELSADSKELLLENLNTAIQFVNGQISTSTHLVITLGTSWVYRHIESDQIVANCHKIPQKRFLKELLTVDEISESLDSIIALVRSINPTVKFIFTVSPVRHLKDGFIENSLSKSHLIAALHRVIEPRKHLHYFPSYEIMLDDLRDYRFYKSDMIHPNDTAIEYIWEAFKNTWIDEGCVELMTKIAIIQKGLVHTPFNEASEQHQLFLEKLNEKIAQLKAQHQIVF